MTKRVRLTAARVSAFACEAGKQQSFLHDTDAPGLALRATPSGAKAYVFESRLNGRTVRLTIGDPGTWTLDAARARARELATLIDKGIDPREEARRQRQAAEAERQRRLAAEVPALTAWEQYCLDRRGAWGERHYQDHLKMVQAGGAPKKRGAGLTAPGPLRGLLSRPLAQLTTQAVEAWAQRQATERRAVAQLAHRMLRAFLNWCAEHPQYRHALPADGNPAKSRKAREALGRPNAKKDALQREQLRPWFKAVLQQEPVIAAYLQTLLLTGARPGELLRLGWSDVEFQWKSLTIRDKVEGERVIPLTPYVAALLAGLPRRGPYVFMSGKAAGPIAPPNHAATRVCTLAGVPPVTLHGLRRSFKSLSEWVEVPVGVVAQIMGHKPSATAEKYYTVRPLDLLAKWHVKIEAWILEQAGIEQPSAEAVQRLRVVA
ncbi:MAG: integrase family protein [Tepidimonas sp.]|nr:integrase family protein [Tepidimonas sp.]